MMKKTLMIMIFDEKDVDDEEDVDDHEIIMIMKVDDHDL